MARSKRKPSGRAKARPVATPSEPEDLEALTSDEAAAADGQDSAQKPEGDAATGDPDATDAPDRADAQASSEDDDGGRGSGGKSDTAAGTKDPVSKKSAKDPVAPSRDKAGTAGTAGNSAKNTKHTKNAESTSGSKSASGNQNTHRGQNSKSAQGSSGGKSAGAATAKSSRDEVAEKAKDPARPRSPKKTAAAEAARSGRRAGRPGLVPGRGDRVLRGLLRDRILGPRGGVALPAGSAAAVIVLGRCLGIRPVRRIRRVGIAGGGVSFGLLRGVLPVGRGGFVRGERLEVLRLGRRGDGPRLRPAGRLPLAPRHKTVLPQPDPGCDTCRTGPLSRTLA